MMTRGSTRLKSPVILANGTSSVKSVKILLRNGILTVVTVTATTGTKLAIGKIVTKFSRIFSSRTLTPNRDPKAVMPFVMTSGTVSTTMSGTTKTPKAEKRVMMREGTVASASIVAGKCGNDYLQALPPLFV